MNAPTIRQLAGVPAQFQAGKRLETGRCALLLIDYQQIYADGPLALPGCAAAAKTAIALRCWAETKGVAVIHVLHEAASPHAPLFAPGSLEVRPLAGLEPADGEAVVIKRLPSSFAGTNLADLLTERGIDTLLIAGLMTHNCVDATAREAFHRGLRVAVIADACATRDLPGPDGQVIPAAVVHAAVLAGLGDRQAEVIDSRELMKMDWT